jgi:hypothetical protein
VGRLGGRTPAENANIIVERFELETRRAEAWASPRPITFELRSAEGSPHPVTGRDQLFPDPELVAIGGYFRRARRYAARSQARVASDANVTQSMVSRMERGLAPGMRLERFVATCAAIGRIFPLGTCPHEHECAWQPISPPEHVLKDAERLLAILLKSVEPSEERSADPETFFDEIRGQVDEAGGPRAL